MDNFLKWLVAILSIIAIITVKMKPPSIVFRCLSLGAGSDLLCLLVYENPPTTGARELEDKCRRQSSLSKGEPSRHPSKLTNSIKSYDVDSSLPHKPSFSEADAPALRPKEPNPYSPYTPIQTPDTEVRSRRPGPTIHPEEDRSLLGLNTSV